MELSEKSLEELCESMRDTNGYRMRPTRYIVPAWAIDEIRANYGICNEETYFKWLARRQ